MPRTILITGCSDGGLGAALALAFHKHGDRVLATARNPSKMAHLKSEGVETLAMDVLSDESLQTAAKEVAALTNGSLDMLINNAGAGYSMPLLDADMRELEKVFKLNVFSVMRTTQVFFPLLRNSKAGAVLVNHSSTACVAPIPMQGGYNASKAAVAMLSENLRLELDPFGIKVVDLRTGGVQSKFFDNTPQGRTAKLPENTPYELSREQIESIIHGNVGVAFMDTDVWASSVVKDLNRSKPPVHIWRGSGATKGWISTMLPHGTFDGLLKKMGGLDVFAKKLREAEAKKTQ
ncbi:uncharacterized protein A1O9_10061 [Exophiala aquamarina CBS 119918]|uniref:Oxidoreductase n=1 Tax=Exophiala aquamarina CBS 119918 TaxID=1182545 RepID=A0A072P1F5_9EURO|nr:uncharacterized protein A1O9_10061 [Exophiala aquamarina CBS 119918]KEF53661.1 hypothetical protein A1O9_10061 [Exophiala aquamarina CBS 119918]